MASRTPPTLEFSYRGSTHFFQEAFHRTLNKEMRRLLQLERQLIGYTDSLLYAKGLIRVKEHQAGELRGWQQHNNLFLSYSPHNPITELPSVIPDIRYGHGSNKPNIGHLSINDLTAKEFFRPWISKATTHTIPASRYDEGRLLLKMRVREFPVPIEGRKSFVSSFLISDRFTDISTAVCIGQETARILPNTQTYIYTTGDVCGQGMGDGRVVHVHGTLPDLVDDYDFPLVPDSYVEAVVSGVYIVGTLCGLPKDFLREVSENADYFYSPNTRSLFPDTPPGWNDERTMVLLGGLYLIKGIESFARSLKTAEYPGSMRPIVENLSSERGIQDGINKYRRTIQSTVSLLLGTPERYVNKQYIKLQFHSPSRYQPN